MKKKTSSIVYQCNIFDVREEDVEFPNGKTARQSWINHNPTVAIVPVNDQNQLLLIKQYRAAVKQDLLEIPAGSLESSEELPAVCAQRELAEETGFQSKTLIKLFEGYLLPGYCNEYMHFFLAKDLFYSPLQPDDDEFIETAPLSLPQARTLIEQGDIIDAKTVLGILLAEKHLRQDNA
jgi:ADP-ribose pyrophosphatase